MRNGYKILWTDYALEELAQTISYLEQCFTEKKIINLAQKIESITELLSRNPFIFPQSEFNQVYKVTILKFNTFYYKILGNEVQILSFFSNRQNPTKRKI